jgi:hypothetical protein
MQTRHQVIGTICIHTGILQKIKTIPYFHGPTPWNSSTDNRHRIITIQKVYRSRRQIGEQDYDPETKTRRHSNQMLAQVRKFHDPGEI